MPNIWESLAQGMQNAQPYKEKYIQGQYEKGALSAMTGGEAPDSYYAIEAYERTKGEVTANKEYQMALDKYYTENRALADPEEFQIGLEELTKQYMEGQTEHFLHGFAPTASSLESQYLNRFNKDKQKEQIDKNYNVIGDMFVGEAGTMMNSIVSDVFEDSFGYTNLTELKEGQPKLYREFFQLPKVQARLTGMMRDMLTHAQKNGEGMGITKTEVTEKFVEFVTAKAVKEGLPELLEIMYIPDKDGVTIAGSMLSSQVRNATEDAEKVHALRMAEIAKMEEGEAKRLAEEQAEAEKLAEAERQKQLTEKYFGYVKELEDLALHGNDPVKLAKRTAEIEAEMQEEGLLTGLLNDSRTNNLIGNITESYEKAYAVRAEQEEINNTQKAQDMKEAMERTTVQIWNGVYNVPLAGSTKNQIEALDQIEQGIDAYVKQAEDDPNTRNLDWREEKNIRQHLAEQRIDIKRRQEMGEDVTDNMALVTDYDFSLIALGEPVETETLYQDYLDGEMTQKTYQRLYKSNFNLMAERKEQAQKLAKAQTQEEKDAILAQQKFMDKTAQDYLRTVRKNVEIAIAETQPDFSLTNEETEHKVSTYFAKQIASFRNREGRIPTVKEVDEIADNYLATFGLSLEAIATQGIGDENIQQETETILQKTGEVMRVTSLSQEDSNKLVKFIEASKDEGGLFGSKVNTRAVTRAMTELGMKEEDFQNYKQHYVYKPSDVVSNIANPEYFSTLGEGLEGLKENESLTEESYAFYERYTLASYGESLAGTLDANPDLDSLGQVINRMNEYLNRENLSEEQKGIVTNYVIDLYKNK